MNYHRGGADVEEKDERAAYPDVRYASFGPPYLAPHPGRPVWDVLSDAVPKSYRLALCTRCSALAGPSLTRAGRF